jgi:hypothetical protein
MTHPDDLSPEELAALERTAEEAYDASPRARQLVRLIDMLERRDVRIKELEAQIKNEEQNDAGFQGLKKLYLRATDDVRSLDASIAKRDELVLSQQQMIAELERENAKLRAAMRIMQDELYKAAAQLERKP